MSQQQGWGDNGTPGVPGIESLTGNSGGAVFGAGTPVNITLVGDNATGINIVGNPGTSTMTVFGIQATTTQVGVSEFADGTETTTGTDGTRAVTPLGLASKLGAQTSHGLAYGNGTTGAIQWLAEATNGQLPIGSTGNVPVLGTLTAGTGIAIVNGPGSITISADAATSGTASTVGAVTGDVITLPLGATPGTYTLEARVSGFEGTTPASAGFQIFGTVRTTGAAAVLVGVPDVVSNAEIALVASLASIVVSGNNAIIQVTGVAGLTVGWKADLQYTFRS